MGRALGPRGLVALVLELVDAVAQLGELGQGLGEPPLLAEEGAVDGQHQRAVAEAGGEGRLPGGEPGDGGVGDREEGREGGHPEGHGQRLGHRHRRHEQGHERPDRPAVSDR